MNPSAPREDPIYSEAGEASGRSKTNDLVPPCANKFARWRRQRVPRLCSAASPGTPFHRRTTLPRLLFSRFLAGRTVQNAAAINPLAPTDSINIWRPFSPSAPPYDGGVARRGLLGEQGPTATAAAAVEYPRNTLTLSAPGLIKPSELTRSIRTRGHVRFRCSAESELYGEPVKSRGICFRIRNAFLRARLPP